MDGLTAEQKAAFDRDGFIIVRRLTPPELLANLCDAAEDQVRKGLPPVEFEASVGYPGSPGSVDQPGGRTIRRLRQAIDRDPVFREWATHPLVVSRLRQLLGPRVVLPLAHHNCIMCKDPKFSSDTGWHRDIRYWRYSKPDLVSVQLALHPLTPDTGSLRFIPGSHRLQLKPEQLDPLGFLDVNQRDNQPLLDRVVDTSLEPGDVVFFHCQTFHAASRNRSSMPRRSLIFTYRSGENAPIPGTTSASLPEIDLSDVS
ncbi:MAG: phytanoyl-CoA dioxygenase family protein [Planctomycetota bacterium]